VATLGFGYRKTQIIALESFLLFFRGILEFAAWTGEEELTGRSLGS
jgi:hypothetical protein